MSLFHNNILTGASGQTTGYQIKRSLRFNNDDSAYLNFTPSSAGNRRTWTWSAWVKFSSSDRQVLFSQTTNAASQFFILEYRYQNLNIYDYNLGTYNSSLNTTAYLRDFSAWYHIVFTFDTTNATADDRHRLYINGEQITSFTSRVNPTQNLDGFVNKAAAHNLSGYDGGTLIFDGYFADVHFIDGQSLAASDFGEYDDNNVWQPKAYSGTYGTNGWHLDFSDATNTTTIAEDSSGNGNDWTANNISVTAGSGNDSLFDSPSNGTQSDTGAGGEVNGNYCTFNDATPSANETSNGALDFAASSGWESVFGTFLIPSSGKWYFELTAGGANNMAGIVEASSDLAANNFPGIVSTSYMYNFGSGKKIQGPSNTQTAYGATGAAADVMGVALDMDGGTLTFYKNGTSQGTAFSSLTGSYIPVVAAYQGSGTAVANFGQRPFAYSAPSGHKCLCSANLPDPTIADGSTGMDVALYTGNGSTQTISGLNFSPDLVWIKARNQGSNTQGYHFWVDIVRGGNKQLFSNATNAESTTTPAIISSFNSDGFSLTNGSGIQNVSGNTYVAWTWDAGSSTVSNTDGSITSSVRANTSTGFSVLTADIDSSGGTIGHGLNASPGFIIGKNRDNSGTNWGVWHSSLNTDEYLLLNSSNAAATSSNIFNGVSSTTFTVGSGWSTASNNHVFYCWTPVEGYSKFGSYTGNQNADGPVIYTGFRPRWIIIKREDSGDNWAIIDAEREGYNVDNDPLYSNSNSAELTTDILDIVSNGFKLRTTDGMVNSSDGTYVYAAFSEHPMKYARAR